MLIATVDDNFAAGPFTLKVNGDLTTLGNDERLIIAFMDFEGLFTVIGQARGAIHLGMFLTPWHYVHWRAERCKDRWSLGTTDRIEITRLRRLCHVSP